MPTSITCLNRIVPVSFRNCRISVHIWTRLDLWTEGAHGADLGHKAERRDAYAGSDAAGQMVAPARRVDNAAAGEAAVGKQQAFERDRPVRLASRQYTGQR